MNISENDQNIDIQSENSGHMNISILNVEKTSEIKNRELDNCNDNVYKSNNSINIPPDTERFLIELEFVQNLSNPKYLLYLSQNNYFKDPEFVNFLIYLQYFKKPEFLCHLIFPQCLAFLDAVRYMYICICIFVFMYICICACIYVYKYICACIYM
jgi:hypothetical protein